MRNLLFLVFGLISVSARAQLQPVLVKDIYQQPDGPTFSSSPRDGVEFNGVLFFAAYSSQYGEELWTSDGTEEGTFLVKDVSPGQSSSGPSFFIEMNGSLFFMARGNLPGLWKTDGTQQGTVRLKDVWVSTGSSQVPPVFRFNDDIYFSAAVPGDGVELWKSDGTEAGTVIVKDIFPGLASSAPENGVLYHFAEAGGILYFVANDGTHGAELWRTDGTEEGTQLVKDIRPGLANSLSASTRLLGLDDVLYFTANDGTHGSELWKSDGTELGTQIIGDLFPPNGSASDPLAVIQGKIFFSGYDPSTTGYEYYISDGTLSGTSILMDINPGSGSGVAGFGVIFQDKLYFHATDGTGSSGLWKTDGTTGGTSLVKYIQTAGTYYVSMSSSDQAIYFTVAGEGLWVSDGTTEGTIQISATVNNQIPMVANELVFVSYDDNLHGSELWKGNSSQPGIELVKDINTESAITPSYLVTSDNRMYFITDDGIHGSELWSTEGTEESTVLTKDINVGSQGSGIIQLHSIGNRLFFTADDGTHGLELWSTTGDELSTAMVKDINPLLASSAPGATGGSAVLNGNLYFVADDGVHGLEVWKSDGTEAGTQMVKDIGASLNDASPQYLTVMNGQLYFTVNMTLWKSDGTEAGTALIKDLKATPTGSMSAYGLTAGTDLLYLLVNDGVHGAELWKSDGTPGGTGMVKDIHTDPSEHYIFILGVVGNQAFVMATDGIFDYEPWTSDGTDAGTLRLKDINPGVEGSTPGFGQVLGNNIYFAATNATQGSELWKSDGTVAGTTLVKDIFPGANGSGPDMYWRPAIGNYIYFGADDGEHGRELWRTNGTAAGTKMMADINPGIVSSRLDWFTKFDEKLFFVSDDNIHGKELWSFDPTLQVITFAAIPDKIATEEPFEITASSSSDLPVTFEIVSGPANISGNTLTITGAGEVVVRATQPGDDEYNPAPTVERTFNIVKDDQFITFETPADMTFGDDPVLMTGVASSSLPVSFSIVSGNATLEDNAINLTGTGMVTVEATQTGNGFYEAADPVQRTFNVAKATQTITFEAIPAKKSDDDPFQLSATASSGLPVSFAVLSGPATISGSTVTLDLITGGTVNIRASQEGNDNYLAAGPVDREFEVALVVGLEETANPILVYPNPVSSTLYVTLPVDNKLRVVRLTDALGRTVLVERAQGVSELALPSSNIGAGVLFLRISTDEDVKVFRVIKE
jgi:ELWxxDGT repeat protein